MECIPQWFTGRICRRPRARHAATERCKAERSELESARARARSLAPRVRCGTLGSE